MKVLHLRSSRGVYGAENVILTLAGESQKRGTGVEIAALRDEREPHLEILERAHRNGIPTHAVSCAGRLDALTVGRIAVLIRTGRFDYLHAHDYKTIAYGVLAARLGGARLVVTLHGDTKEDASVRFYEGLSYQAVRFAHRVATVSRELWQKLERAIPKKAVYIPNGIDTDALRARRHANRDLRSELGVPSDHTFALAVGRLSVEKSHVTLIEATARVPRLFVAIAGAGPLESDLERRAHELGVAHRVKLLGERTDTADLYACADIFVHPSIREGLPLVILEAAAFARPIIATAVGEIPSVLDDGAAALVPALNPMALADALARVSFDRDQAMAAGERAQKRVDEHYSARAMSERYHREVYV